MSEGSVLTRREFTKIGILTTLGIFLTGGAALKGITSVKEEMEKRGKKPIGTDEFANFLLSNKDGDFLNMSDTLVISLSEAISGNKFKLREGVESMTVILQGARHDVSVEISDGKATYQVDSFQVDKWGTSLVETATQGNGIFHITVNEFYKDKNFKSADLPKGGPAIYTDSLPEVASMTRNRLIVMDKSNDVPTRFVNDVLFFDANLQYSLKSRESFPGNRWSTPKYEVNIIDTLKMKEDTDVPISGEVLKMIQQFDETPLK